MAFFGITSFGPQNTLECGLQSALALTLFTEEEFMDVFERLDKDQSGFIEINEIRELLKQTYNGFEPLEEEVQLFMEQFDLNRDGKVSWEEFRTTLQALKEQVQSRAVKAKEYTSYEKLKEHKRKHIRFENELTTKYKLPMTAGQTIGFFEFEKERLKPTTNKQNFNRNQCNETKYADAMIKNGHATF